MRQEPRSGYSKEKEERLSEGMYFGLLRSEDGVSVVKMIKQ